MNTFYLPFLLALGFIVHDSPETPINVKSLVQTAPKAPEPETPIPTIEIFWPVIYLHDFLAHRGFNPFCPPLFDPSGDLMDGLPKLFTPLSPQSQVWKKVRRHFLRRVI